MVSRMHNFWILTEVTLYFLVVVLCKLKLHDLCFQAVLPASKRIKHNRAYLEMIQ